MARQACGLTSSRGALRNCRQRLMSRPLAKNTVASQSSNCAGGAQNIAPTATIEAIPLRFRATGASMSSRNATPMTLTVVFTFSDMSTSITQELCLRTQRSMARVRA